MPSRGARRLAGAIALLALAPSAWGICLPLPAPEMQALDRVAEGDPEHGIAEAEARDGFGLKMMAYRARLVGATCRIEPGPLTGTRVVVVMPMTEATSPATADAGSARADLDQQ